MSWTWPASDLVASRYPQHRDARYFSAIMQAKKLTFPQSAKPVDARASTLMWLAVRQTPQLCNRKKFLVNTTLCLQKQEALWKQWRLAPPSYSAITREADQWLRPRILRG